MNLAANDHSKPRADFAIRRYLANCILHGTTPGDICAGDGAHLIDPTWDDAEAILKRRWQQMESTDD